ncbi:MAG: DUF7379 domain-containing protein [Myxococcota bacterium]
MSYHTDETGVRARVGSGYRPRFSGLERRPGTVRRSAEEIRRDGFLEAIRDALGDARFDESDRLTLARVLEVAPPDRGTGTRRGGALIALPGARVDVDLEVPLGEDETAVVVVQEGAVARWYFPELQAGPVDPRTPRRRGSCSGRPAVGTFRFSLDLSDTTLERARRGAWWDKVVSGARTLVLRWATRALQAGLGSLVKTLEERVRERQLLHIRSVETETWRPVDSLSEALPDDWGGSPPRILALVHGTFSSTHGCFGGLADESTRPLLAAALEHYDAVVGFDHRTLSVTPKDNAGWIWEVLCSADWQDWTPQVDIVCHSRGALVVRTLIEELAPRSDSDLRFGEVAMVAPTNGGTLLASPRHWHDLLDHLTTITAGVAWALSPVPEIKIAAEIAKDWMSGLVVLVKALATATLDGDVAGAGVPGLWAMAPEGDYLERLDSLEPHTAVPPSYRLATVDFEPESLSLLRVADAAVDRLFKGAANDLVVDNASATRLSQTVMHWVDDDKFHEDRSSIVHTSFFSHRRVAKALARWLLPADATLWPELPQPGRRRLADVIVPDMPGLDAPSAQRQRRATRNRRRSTSPLDSEQVIGLNVEDAAFDESAGAFSGDDTAGGAPATRPFSVRATPPERLPVGAEAPLRVQLGRDELTAGSGQTVGSGDGRPDRALEVEVICREGVRLACEGSGVQRVPFPTGDSIQVVDFWLVGARAGPGRAIVRVSQADEVRVQLPLDFEVTSGGTTQLGRVSHRAAQVTTRRGPAELEVIRLRQDGQIVLRYELRTDGDRVDRQVFHSRPIPEDWPGYITRLYERLTDAWDQAEHDAHLFERRLRALGAELCREVVPERLNQALHARWGQLQETGLHLVAEGPDLPWELVHLLDPDTCRVHEESRFLVDLGLTRGLWDISQDRKIEVGRERFVVAPDYPHRDYRLPQARHEAMAVADALGAVSVPGRTAVVLDRLAKGFDLLHFACHGEAAVGDGTSARLMMEGAVSGDSWRPGYLDAGLAREFISDRPGKAVVVLNACEVGRAGRILTGPGGWVQAFLEGGVQLLVVPNWPIDDASARTFVNALYEAFRSEEPPRLGAAVRGARDAARKEGDPSWIAYSVYGLPTAEVIVK